ncbi:ORF71 [Alphabaculovirus altermyunipunctae]|uniref:ORF71 n=1 Tax=Mythimna unipuncta nucleopolyhedrovirus TaxID=447897 RepID=A0A346TPK8_9ABAC|nr:ORF71 [Mythimna unipuncta nucleopolyhedrovirus]AXU41518.1 ORF71 [Mythimna unipuncta nucleopolyhedrovirus]
MAMGEAIYNKKNYTNNMRQMFNQHEPVVGSTSNFCKALKRSYLEYMEVLKFNVETARNNAMVQLQFDENMMNGFPSISYASQMEERSLNVKRQIVDKCVSRRDISGLYKNCLFFNLLAERSVAQSDKDKFLIKHYLFMRKLMNELMKTITNKDNVFDDWFVIYAWALIIYVDYLLHSRVYLKTTYEKLRDDQGMDDGDELELILLNRAYQVYEDWSSQQQLFDMKDRLGHLMKDCGKYRFGRAPCTCIVHKYNEVLPVYVALLRLNVVDYALNTLDRLTSKRLIVDRCYLKLSQLHDHLHCHLDIRVYTAQTKYKNCDPALCDSINYTVWSADVPIETKTSSAIKNAIEQVCDCGNRGGGGLFKKFFNRMCVIS